MNNQEHEVEFIKLADSASARFSLGLACRTAVSVRGISTSPSQSHSDVLDNVLKICGRWRKLMKVGATKNPH